ncbi:MAG: hypothetical protein R2705_14975 [Ilumatobacteraceae bacterium]
MSEFREFPPSAPDDNEWVVERLRAADPATRSATRSTVSEAPRSRALPVLGGGVAVAAAPLVVVVVVGGAGTLTPPASAAVLRPKRPASPPRTVCTWS